MLATATAVPVSTETAPPPAPIRTVLIDDHDLIVESFSLLLNASPAVDLTFATQDPQAGLAHILSEPTDVAVIDYRLGDGVSGIDLARTIRSQRPNTKVLLLTGYADATLAAAVVRVGASGVLPKSTTAARLFDAIQSVHGGEHVQDPALVSETLSILARPEGQALLTVREREVLQLVASGKTNKEVAARLSISPKTVATHLDRVNGKLKTKGRMGAVNRARRLGELARD